MRLTRDVHLVGGGPTIGFGLSTGMDCHVYVLRNGEELAMIDCGMAMPGSMEMILDNMREDGLDPEGIGRLFLTHYHADHAGGAAAWRDHSELEVAISRDAKPALETADVEATGFRLAQQFGIYPDDYEYRPCPVDDPLADGDTRRVGALEVEFIATPGHCTGHGAYLVTGGDRTYLFTGDCVFYGGTILQQNIADCDMHAYRESILRLDELSFDALLPGHGAIALSDAAQHVTTAADAFRGLLLPENFL